ncbi:MAG: hypothetical protein ACM3X9_04015 [Bacillota bacterium]
MYLKLLKNLHIGLIVLAFVITVGALFGGEFLTTKFKVVDPLKRDLQTVKAIKDFSVKQGKDGMVISLRLRKVDNLQKVLDYVEQRAEFYYNLPVKTFKISDQRNTYLEEVRYQLSFYLEEAAVSGHYIQLKQELDSCRGVRAKAYFSQNNIYLQLEKGANYLYEVIPVPAKALTFNNNSGGDSA